MKIKSLVFTYLLTANSTVTKMVATMSLKSLIKAARRMSEGLCILLGVTFHTVVVVV